MSYDLSSLISTSDRDAKDTHGHREDVRTTRSLYRAPVSNTRILFSYPQLVGVRICLGVAEAGLFPGVVY